MKKSLGLFASSFLVIFSMNTHAGGILNVGVDYLMMTAEMNSAKAEPTALQLRISTGLIPFVDLEAVLATSVDDDKFANSGATIELSTLKGVYAKSGFDAIPMLSIYGKLGYISYEYDFSGGAKANDSGAAYGLGVALDLPLLGTVIVEQNFYPDIKNSGAKLETSVISIGYHVGI